MTREEAIRNLIILREIATLKETKECADMAIEALKQPELLTYDEQCIFLSAMSREKKLCEKLDKNPVAPPKQSLVYICQEIVRKVKATLWGDEE